MRIDYPRKHRTGVTRLLPSWRQLLAVVVLALVACFGAFGVAYAKVDVPAVKDTATSQVSIVTWSDGTELGRFGSQNRIDVDIHDLPDHVKYAVMAAEDRNFYENSGVSPVAITRSAWNNLTGGATQGGSTITQQYVKNAYLTHERTFDRKAKEVLIALKINRERDKDQILQDYLNTIYWGRSAYGIQTAAQSYFGVPASKLTVSQSALLAGIIQSPEGEDPRVNPDAALRRWNYVLDGMVSKGWLTPAQRATQQFPKVRKLTRNDRFGGTRGYLLEQVRKELLAHGFTERELEVGGLRITTTFNRRAQGAAEQAVQSDLASSTPKDIDLHVALAAVKPGDGAVVAMYGGKDYLKQQFNDATQGTTQPGSTFKAFALAGALEDGVSLRSRYSGASGRSFPQYDHGRPVPNDGGESFGNIDLVQAMAHSVNTVYVDLGLQIGNQKVRDAAVAAGIPQDADNLNATPSNVLGVAFVHPIDMASAYGTFAAEGRNADWYTVAKVTDSNGARRYVARPHATQAFPKDVSADVSYALQSVVTRGTAHRVASTLGRPAAGKTGTTNNNRSAWFVGYTPQLSTAVAMWDGDNNPSLKGYGTGSRVTGNSYPTRIWRDFMHAALEGVAVKDFPQPAWVGSQEGTATTDPTVGSPAQSTSSATSSTPDRAGGTPTETPTSSTNGTPTGPPTSTPTRPGETPSGPPGPTKPVTLPPTKPGVTTGPSGPSTAETNPSATSSAGAGRVGTGDGAGAT